MSTVESDANAGETATSTITSWGVCAPAGSTAASNPAVAATATPMATTMRAPARLGPDPRELAGTGAEGSGTESAAGSGPSTRCYLSGSASSEGATAPCSHCGTSPSPRFCTPSARCRVVEIGALRGETTVKMLDDLGPDAELHVIDPVPDFDPGEHERAFPGRYVFHEALSLDVLPTLAPMDAALIDGDHNWYTVYHELRLLADGARRAGRPMPVMVMHDVLWPYGRRDLYYAPEQIPEEFRQPYAQKGMRPGGTKLLERGGLNPTMCNALEEGGPRNGVMTAVDDFVAEYDRPLRVVVLPIYFGLAIVVEEERLADQPELAAVLDHLEDADGRRELLEVGEQVRLRAMMFQHNVFFQRNQQLDRAQRRYLDTVKSSLLNEHYLDHEVRFEQLTAHIDRGRPLVAGELRDPVRNDQVAYRRIAHNRLGPGGPDVGAATSFLPYAPMGRAQLDHLERCLDAICAEPVAGDLVECGTGRGGAAIFMRAYLDAREVPERRVFVADRFRASDEPASAPTVPGRRGRRLPGRPEPRARRLRALRPARRPGALPAGSGRARPSARRPRVPWRCCASGARPGPRRAGCSVRCTTGSRRAAT